MSSSFFVMARLRGGQKTHFHQFYPFIVVCYAQSEKIISGIPPNLSCSFNNIYTDIL